MGEEGRVEGERQRLLGETNWGWSFPEGVEKKKKKKTKKKKKKKKQKKKEMEKEKRKKKRKGEKRGRWTLASTFLVKKVGTAKNSPVMSNIHSAE